MSKRKRVAVLGAGESGIGAALLAKKKEMNVFVSDFGEIPKERKQELIINNIPFEEKGHTIEKLEKADVFIKSPGIPDKAAVVARLRETGKEIISEIEFAFPFAEGKIIGITGSNGKTTTTNLTYHIMKSCNKDVAMGGNVGVSFARLLSERTYEWYVLELSSFQLDGIREFRPDIGVLLNITPDHLDRYEYDIDLYAASKMRIAMNMSSGDTLIYNEMDPMTAVRVGKMKSPDFEVYPVKAEDQGSITDVIFRDTDHSLSLERCGLIGKHNRMNASIASLAAYLTGVKWECMQEAIDSFENDPHRLEYVAKIDEVTYINDSKATNVDAVYYALEAMNSEVIWIAGGQDKGNDYSALETLVEKKVKALICLGIDNAKILEAFSTKVGQITETTDVLEAVKLAASYAHPGDTVLLSPACASFDLFDNYKQRGKKFKSAVKTLEKTE